MENVEVRIAQPKDASQIAKVHVKTWQNAYKGQLPQSYLDNLSIEKRQLGWEKTLNDAENKTKVFVAKKGEKIIGFISVCPCRDEDMPEKTGELGAIYVGSNFTNHGIGSQLLESGLTYLRELGFNKATLWVLESNEKTRKWYESKGWKIEGKRKSEPREGFSLDEIRYITEL